MRSKKGGLWVGLVICISTVGLVLWRSHETPVASRQVRSDCSNGSRAHDQLAKSESLELRKLSEYETLCKGAVVDKLMTFAAMPRSEAESKQYAADQAVKLKEFSRAGIAPLVVFEPSLASPTIINDIYAGMYDDVLASYYANLQLEGVDEAVMGTWVLFPEANTPLWRVTDPSMYSANVTKVAKLQRQVFPRSKISILLNSYTYPSDDTSWSNGEARSLVPYVAGIPKGLVDSFGYQGFPYMSPANAPSRMSQLEARDFLPHSLAIEAAKKLEVSDVWLNTGTFKSKYGDVPAKRVEVGSSQRETILTGVLEEAIALKNQSLTVGISLFAADKSDTSERVDWSYWSEGTPPQGPDTVVFDTFVRRVRTQEIGFSLYDYDHTT